MKIIKCLPAAICSALFALIGCQTSPKPVFKVPPSLQAGYVDGGGTLQWAPTGEPFQIYWYGANPCSPNDTLYSDGSSVVTCHVMHGGINGGSYAYDVDKPGTKSAHHKGILMMHVGPCKNCPSPTPPSESQESANSTDQQNGNEVRISCPKPGAATLVEPSAATGLKVGDEVDFEYLGQYPSTGDALTITFPANYCKDLPSPYQNQIVGVGGFCQILSAGTTSYTAQAADCSPNKDATITAQ